MWLPSNVCLTTFKFIYDFFSNINVTFLKWICYYFKCIRDCVQLYIWLFANCYTYVWLFSDGFVIFLSALLFSDVKYLVWTTIHSRYKVPSTKLISTRLYPYQMIRPWPMTVAMSTMCTMQPVTMVTLLYDNVLNGSMTSQCSQRHSLLRYAIEHFNGCKQKW